MVKYRMMGVKEMKIKLKKAKVETKCAASPKLALPRNILNRTWKGEELFSRTLRAVATGQNESY